MILLKDEDIKNLLFSEGFYFNEDTEYLTLKKNKINEIDLINENIEIYKNIIDENIDQDKVNENERKEQKEKNNEMKKKKYNNSKKLIDYIMTDEIRKEKEKGKEEIDNLSEENAYVRKNKKKKKKLVKKAKNELDSIQEEDEKDIKGL